jgi:hypothetical protein
MPSFSTCPSLVRFTSDELRSGAVLIWGCDGGPVYTYETVIKGEPCTFVLETLTESDREELRIWPDEPVFFVKEMFAHPADWLAANGFI